MCCTLGGSVSSTAQRGTAAAGWARCDRSSGMGTAVGRRPAGRTRTLGSPGTCLAIAALTWGTVLWVEVGAWTYHYSDQGDYTWEQARNYCQTFFTDLVAIQNQQEIEYLNRSLPYHKHYYWIGIRKLGGTWTWVGTRKALTKEAENWALGEPNNRRSNQDCVEIYIQRPQQAGKWNDEPCSRKKKALCYRASCQPSLCSQRGECVETIGSYRCQCYPGFQGPECADAVQCAKLEPEGLTVSCSHPYGDFSYNSSCQFGCPEGFERRGAAVLRCLPSQQWSADIPTCTGRVWQGLGVYRDPVAGMQHALSPAISCPVLAPPSRGQLSCSHLHGNFTYNSTCSFSCQEGFVRMGAEMLRCEATGNWTRDPPVCAEDGAFLKQVLAYSSGSALAVAGVVLSGGLIALLARKLSDREEKKKLLKPTSDLGAPGTFTNAAYDANL
ncbi:L-selectin-like [Parus major]|uniref:L-selectin-like n=1 Tax=Parus major TaxID=9157 RepID=UPI001444063A|nr:L-selectin-like [Parus major]